MLTAAVNKQLAGRNSDAGGSKRILVAFNHQAKHIPIRSNTTRAGFWHEEVGEGFCFFFTELGEEMTTQKITMGVWKETR